MRNMVLIMLKTMIKLWYLSTETSVQVNSRNKKMYELQLNKNRSLQTGKSNQQNTDC